MVEASVSFAPAYHSKVRGAHPVAVRADDDRNDVKACGLYPLSWSGEGAPQEILKQCSAAWAYRTRDTRKAPHRSRPRKSVMDDVKCNAPSGPCRRLRSGREDSARAQ